MNRFMVLALIHDERNSHTIIRLPFKNRTCNKDGIIYTETIEPQHMFQVVLDNKLFICHTLRNNLIVAFYTHCAHLLDENLSCQNIIQWSHVLPVRSGGKLMNFSIAPNHSQSHQGGFICGFRILTDEIDNVSCRSVHRLRQNGIT